MASDGSIKISIEVDGKEVTVAAKELDKLEQAGSSVGKGVKAAESSVSSLADSSAKAGKDVKGAADSIDGLADSGSKASKDLKGADGAIDGIADSSAQATSSVKGVGDSLDSMSGKASDAASSVDSVKSSTEGMGEGTTKASISLKDLAVSLGLVAVASAAWDTMKSSMDSAIKRFDTLNTFPKVLQALGVSAEDSEAAMAKLSDGIDGLPTTLDDIAGSAQQMYNSFKDIDKTTDTAIALNNALLASGADAEKAKRGTDQYIKSIQTGQVNMDTWNTLQETMGIGLSKLAEEFGYAGASAENDLYKALQNGEVTFDQFNNKLIELGTGTGELAKLAKTNSLGIATSLGNLKNAAARGIANIIDSFNELSKAVTKKDIAQNIDSLKAVVNAAFKAMGSAIEATTPVIKIFAGAVKATLPVVQALTPAIVGLMAAYGAYLVISKVSAAIKASNAILAIAMASNKALTLSITASATASGADAVAKAAQAGSIKLSTLAIGVMTGRIKLSTAAQVIATTASYAFGAALKFLMGPVGWITAGIGLLVTGTIALVKWFNKQSDESKKLESDMEKLAESNNNVIESVESSSAAYQEQRNEMESTATANQNLAREIESLSEKENKSAQEKELLRSKVEELNGSIDGLNLAYNDEAEALNMSSEELQARLELTKEQTSYNDALERQVEIAKEQHEVASKLSETNSLQEELNQLYEDGAIKKSEYQTKTAELEEQQESLRLKLNELGVEYQEVDGQIQVSMDNIAEAVQNGAAAQVVSFEMLSESNQQMVEDMKATWQDYEAAATDMFDRLSDKSTHTVQDMQSNLEENQRVISEWAEGIATLAERGVDDGLLETLRAAGPESAGHVNALVNASDTELEKLSSTFENGGKVATDALNKSLGIEESGIMETVGHLVTGTKESMASQVKAANFTEIGVDIATGLAKGTQEGTPEVEKSAKDMSKAAEDAARKESETQSPSRVFKRIGGDLADGLALGISDGTNKVQQAIVKMLEAVMKDSKTNFDKIVKDHERAVKDIETVLKKLPKVMQSAMRETLSALRNGTSPQIQVMRRLSVDLLKPFNNTPAQFRSIGMNAMAGLNAGLNSRAGSVMNTARRIASSVAATMKKALKIHSPSRLMRDDIGKMIPAGVAIGIEDNASLVYKALNGLSDGMTMGTPEMALGGGYKMMGANMGVSTMTETIREINHNNVGGGPMTVEIVTNLDGREVAREIVEDVTKLQNNKKYGDRKARRR